MSAQLEVEQFVPPAYHLAPAAAVATDGPLVAELCDLAGFHPDQHQRLVLDDVFAVNDQQLVAAGEAAVIAARQNLKTAVLEMCVLGWVYVVDVPLTIWSSHEGVYALEAMDFLENLILSNRQLRRRFVKTVRAPSRLALHFTNDQRVLFKTRTTGGGRSLTANRLILDEGYAVRSDHIGALRPTLSAVPDPQIVTGSSACHVDSDVLRTLVKRGRSAARLDPAAAALVEPRLAYAEWANDRQGQCARGKDCTHHRGTPGCLADDPDEWYPANPTLGYRIKLVTIQDERRSLPPEQFVRERMGWHEGLDDLTALALEAWTDSVSDRKIVSGRAIAVDISPRRDSTSIALVGKDAKGRRRGELLDHYAGTKGAARKVIKYAERWNLDQVLIVAGSEAQTIRTDVVAAGLDIKELSIRELGRACSDLYDLVKAGDFGHPDQIELATAIDGARLRDNGEGAPVWSRKNSSTNISPLMALTAALFGSITTGDIEYFAELPDAEDQ